MTAARTRAEAAPTARSAPPVSHGWRRSTRIARARLRTPAVDPRHGVLVAVIGVDHGRHRVVEVAPARWVSTIIADVSIRRRRIVTSVMTPVRPIPPAVAQNRSASLVGESSNTPLGACKVIRSTWCAMLPSRWWFLPWMSAAIAPPIVTSRVPGETGTKKPSGMTCRNSVSRLVPAATRIVAVASSSSGAPFNPVTSITSPPAFCAASP